ncbi:hypothetical protein SARI_04636 [Salmonella enterica subsp. arizonae serovar 62:z4,z23:-]|uniref:Uncharacterized protein n=1 Tax=Salmonella arizonae (strain ATCC BAA-731 / CDC346-86 / RSK2980) TaxID=41514 RepID=A9MRK8_SALAR|nr:hypothetical protein SARI_04636 [Salmonella enterica subsp. arizonae serovar 62:z4,z23:-]
MIATAVLKITTHKNETLFYLLLKSFIQTTIMPLNKSKRRFDYCRRDRFINGGEGGRKAKYS